MYVEDIWNKLEISKNLDSIDFIFNINDIFLKGLLIPPQVYASIPK